MCDVPLPMKNIRNSSLQDLETLLVEWGEPKFRAKQVYEWIWQKHAVALMK